eukprot:gb/GFBE01046823.1/.p1 GENE.gb/GFBE01046823.1/~~gb/GFBE01046823.1/.p1  ORF type:complete len:294 (+),score=41.26 gb/GFBE01046823.1/:1-882(+)
MAPTAHAEVFVGTSQHERAGKKEQKLRSRAAWPAVPRGAGSARVPPGEMPVSPVATSEPVARGKAESRGRAQASSSRSACYPRSPKVQQKFEGSPSTKTVQQRFQVVELPTRPTEEARNRCTYPESPRDRFSPAPPHRAAEKRHAEAIKTLHAVESALQAVQTACQQAQQKAVQQLCTSPTPQLLPEPITVDEFLSSTTCSASSVSSEGITRMSSSDSLGNSSLASTAASAPIVFNVSSAKSCEPLKARGSLAAARAAHKERVKATQRSVQFVSELQGKIGELRTSVAAMQSD